MTQLTLFYSGENVLAVSTGKSLKVSMEIIYVSMETTPTFDMISSGNHTSFQLETIQVSMEIIQVFLETIQVSNWKLSKFPTGNHTCFWVTLGID